MRTDDGEVEIQVPRDRHGTFAPQLIGKYKRALPGFDEEILSRYARGMSTQKTRGPFEALSGVDASVDFVTRVTDSVVDERKRWQSRPLYALYPIVDHVRQRGV